MEKVQMFIKFLDVLQVAGLILAICFGGRYLIDRVMVFWLVKSVFKPKSSASKKSDPRDRENLP